MQIKNYNELDLKRVVRTVNLVIPAQTAKLGPPVGPVLGQVKIKVKDFCTLFNDTTSIFKLGLPLPVTVFVFKNETFNFLIKTPTVSFLLKNHSILNQTDSFSILDIYKIALIKHQDLEHLPIKSVFTNVLVTAKLLKFKIIK
jgi:large subunit ribosomal protein L11